MLRDYQYCHLTVYFIKIFIVNKKQFYKIMVIESVINEELYLSRNLSCIRNMFILLNLVNNMFLFCMVISSI